MVIDEQGTAPDLTVGVAAADEIGATLDADELGFGVRMRPQARQAILEASIPDRSVVSRDGSDIVGVSVSVPLQMTLPGPAVAPIAAIVGVAVWPTHRRQGRLRSMMRYQLEDLRRRGEHIAVLTSSEARIYQRFGYGPATLASGYTVDTRHLHVLPGGLGRSATGRVRFVDRSAAAGRFPALFEAYQATRAGEVGRLPLGWEEVLGYQTEEDQRDRFFVQYEEGGSATGYAIYRIVTDTTGPPRRTLRVVDLCSLTPASYTGLWSYLVDIDLVETLETSVRPVDEPIRWALSDYRRMRTLWTTEHTFVRLVDVQTALAARRYNHPGELSLEVRDSFCDWIPGGYRLYAEDSPDGAGVAACERLAPGSTGSDLELDVSALASVYLGGLRPSMLADVGLIAELRPGALDLADRMFCGQVPPMCSTVF